MALYEYYCDTCKSKFERISSYEEKKEGESTKCPKCQGNQTKRLISAFRVAGQGDLRESTMHGCHGCFTGLHSHGHHKKTDSST